MDALLKLEDLYVEHHVKHGGYDHAKVGRCYRVCHVQAACVFDASDKCFLVLDCSLSIP
jgi:hypothetical protein